MNDSCENRMTTYTWLSRQRDTINGTSNVHNSVEFLTIFTSWSDKQSVLLNFLHCQPHFTTRSQPLQDIFKSFCFLLVVFGLSFALQLLIRLLSLCKIEDRKSTRLNSSH